MGKEDFFHRDNKDSWYMSNSKMKEFKVNKYILLRLEGREALIYVNKKRFIYCARLILNIPKKDVDSFNGIQWNLVSFLGKEFKQHIKNYVKWVGISIKN